MSETLPIPARRNANQRAAALSASDYSHVVIDPLPIGHPVLWVGAKQPESLASIRIRIGHR
jgi:hypothetical protein